MRVRLWRGTMDDGRAVDVFVARVGSADPYTQEALARQLAETTAPVEMTLTRVRLQEELARLAPVVEAARRAVLRYGTVSVDEWRCGEWEALCKAVAELEESERGA